MDKREYTELERELYEKLAKIFPIRNEMVSIFSNNVFNYARQNKEEMSKWIMKIVNNLVKLDKVLEEAKIPKKFMILDSLDDKNE